MIEELRELSQTFIHTKYEGYQRYFIKQTPMKHRFSIILGERGIGKTTTIIQHLLSTVNGNMQSEEILYVQADHFLVKKTALYNIAERFEKLGGKTIAFDEIHKYPEWSMELKSVTDTFPKLRILASGSSALEIHKGSHDLSRRAITYRMVGLSFREFIELKYNMVLPTYSLNQIIEQHTNFAFDIIQQLATKNLKVLKVFQEYLISGFYPYFREFDSIDEFKISLEQNLHTTIESDLAAIYPKLTGNSIKRIKNLLVYIAQSVPFTPNWKTIKQITDISDDRTLKTYFKYLEDANIIRSVSASSKGLKKLEMPEKIYLGNTNQLFTLTGSPNIGNLRETVFLAMTSHLHHVNTAKKADFKLNDEIYIEVGGKNKDTSQIYDLDHAYLALDNIEHGVDRRIPLWLFGFLY